MRTREKILQDLISFTEDITKLQLELSHYPWDVENSIVVVTNSGVYNVLSNFKTNNLSMNKLEDWANAIESRDDVEFESEKLKEIINQIANPALYGQLSHAQLKKFMQMLERK